MGIGRLYVPYAARVLSHDYDADTLLASRIRPRFTIGVFARNPQPGPVVLELQRPTKHIRRVLSSII